MADKPTRLTLKPGQRGTHKLAARYGDRLMCVRYRYGEQWKKRYKTVELIVEAARRKLIAEESRWQSQR
jgi:hypothetical protein